MKPIDYTSVFEVLEEIISNKQVEKIDFGRPRIMFQRKYNETKHKGLGIKRILINAPATVVFWADGTKTVAKCGPNDNFDAEKGVFICMLKKQFNMNNVEFSKYMDYVEKKVK